MNKVERLAYIITSELKDRPVLERFTRAEYLQLVELVEKFCRNERKATKGENNGSI
jgi:hypothetical protein